MRSFPIVLLTIAALGATACGGQHLGITTPACQRHLGPALCAGHVGAARALERGHGLCGADNTTLDRGPLGGVALDDTLLLTRRPNLAMWERSKLPEGDAEADVRAKLSRRYDLCDDTDVFTTTLLTATDRADAARWT